MFIFKYLLRELTVFIFEYFSLVHSCFVIISLRFVFVQRSLADPSIASVSYKYSASLTF